MREASYVKAFESWQTDMHTHRQTDTTEIIYHAASRMVKNMRNHDTVPT